MVIGIALIVAGVAVMVWKTWQNARITGQRLPAFGLVTMCVLWAGLVTAIAINAVVGGVLFLAGLGLALVPGRWKHRLRGGQVRKLPPETVDALIALYSTAMASDDIGQRDHVRLELPLTLALPDLALLQLALLTFATRDGRRRLSEGEKNRFIRDARAAKIAAAQLIDPEIAQHIMNAVNGRNRAAISYIAGTDRQDYRSRLMPTMVGLTAFAYSCTPGDPSRWQNQIRTDFRKYERTVGYRLAPVPPTNN